MRQTKQATVWSPPGAFQAGKLPANPPLAKKGPSKIPEDLQGKAIERPPAVADEVDRARLRIGASLNSAAVVWAFAGRSDDEANEFNCLIRALSDGVQEVWAGDQRQSEAMLYGQAHALQAIFMNLSRKAAQSTLLDRSDRYLRLALKAQNQCRMTLETLATIKNPPVVFTRQANINNGGQQQVNNGVPKAPMATPATNSKSGADELLETPIEQRLDTRAPGATSGVDPHVEAVGALHRTANS